MSIFYIGHTYGRIGYSVVNHCVYGYCYTVFGQNLEFFSRRNNKNSNDDITYLLRRDSQSYGPQIHFLVGLYTRHNKEYSWKRIRSRSFL